MNSLDFLVLIFSLALGVRGFRKGVIREGSEIVIAVISVLVAAKYEYMVAERLGWFVGLSLPIARAMSFFAIAVTWTAIGFFAISWWHKKIVFHEHLLLADSFLGLLFGFCKGMFYGALIIIVLFQSPLGTIRAALHGSVMGRTVVTMAPVVDRYMSK